MLQVRTEGTIFSLRSRSQPSTYLSLNLDGPDVIRLIQSTPNGTQSVVIPAAIADGHWHQLALGYVILVSIKHLFDPARLREHIRLHVVTRKLLRKNK